MKKIPLIFLAVLMHLIAFSQINTELKWGSLNKNESGTLDFQIFNLNNGFLSLRFLDDGEFLLEEFNKNLEKVGNKEIELDTEKSFKRKTEFLGTFIFNSKWYLSFTHYDNESDLQTLYVQEVTKSGLKERIKITSLDAVTARKQQNVELRVVDSNTVVALAFTPFESKKEPLLGSLLILDNKFKKIKEKKFSTLIDGKVFAFYADPDIDMNGNMYFLAKVYQDRSEDKREKLELVKYDFASNKFIKLKLGFAKYGINEVITKYIPSSNKIIAVGFLSKENDSKNATESYFSSSFFQTFDLNNGGKVDKEKITTIPEDEMAKLIGAKKARKEKEAYHVAIRKVIINENSSITLMGEKYYRIRVERRQDNGISTPTGILQHYFLDVVVASFDSEGNFGSVSVIPKYQIGSTGDGSGFTPRKTRLRNEFSLSSLGYMSFYHNEKPTILFNDDVDNCPPGGNRENVEDPDPFTGERKCSIVIGKFDERGKLKAKCEGKQIVEDEQLFLKTPFYHKLDENTYLLVGTTMRGKQYAFGTLKFK